MERSDDQPIGGPERTPNQRLLVIAGLGVLAIGLFSIIIGVVLGQLVYAAEQPLHLVTQRAVQGLTIETEDGRVVSAGEYSPPTFVGTVLSQQPTWLGAAGVILGLCMLYASVPRAESGEQSVAQEAPPREPDDSPFDLDH